MTPKQAAVVAAIRELTVDGVAPTYKQILQHTGIKSGGSLCATIDRLVRQGVLVREAYRSRSLRIVEGPSREEMERWSDVEVRRVTLDLYEIGRARGLGRRVAA